jgi:Tol biopolymer transport system component/DNA-binding winged helix-turn-helix (wHTH) protein
MLEQVPNPQVVRFGTFEVDLRLGELRKNGIRVKLTGQPFQILVILLEHPGDLVTRKQLQRRLWPSDTFVDFDRGLNAAINRVREALGDSAENPRFVETLPRRGYRFIAPLVDSRPVGATLPASESNVSPAQTVTRLLPAGVLAVITLAAGIGWLHFHKGNSSVSGATPRMVPFTSSPGAKTNPAFSPDGKEVAFGWMSEKDEGLRIYVKLVGAGTPLRLTAGPGDDDSPAWSPDGRFVAFVRHSGSMSSYFIVPSLGGPERKIAVRYADTFNYERLVNWLPDGKNLLVADQSSPQDPYISLVLISLENGRRQVVLTPPGPYLADATSSPDGKYIAFRQGGGSMSQEIYVMRVDGSDASRLTSDKALIQGLAWTQDSKSIVFSSSRAGLQSLWRIPVSGGVPSSVISAGDDAAMPTISREGAQLAFVLSRANSNIWRVAGPAAKFSPPSRLIASSRWENDANFSPDGKRIAFSSTRTGTQELWLCNSDGSNAVQLTSLAAPSTDMPRWSPDGKQIAFDSVSEGHSKILLISTEGGSPRQLAEGPFGEVQSWSHDGKWVYFSSNRSGAWEIWKVSPEGGSPVQVTKQPASRASGGTDLGMNSFESADGKFLFYRRDEGLWRMLVEGGESTRILKNISMMWRVCGNGICFLDEKENPARLKRLDLRSGRTTSFGSVDLGKEGSFGNFDVSPDGRWVIYPRVDTFNSDIMLLEDFH